MPSSDADITGPAISYHEARHWIDRWDAQQHAYLPHREERFIAMMDAVELASGRPDPLVLDLGCGPGSLAVLLLERMPDATVVAVDADPVLLSLGRAAWSDREDLAGLRFADRDLRVPGWSRTLGLDRPADAVVSTTALHWLTREALAAMYTEVATVLRPGGLLLNGDHLAADAGAAPTLARLERALTEREELRHHPGGHTESWSEWWAAAADDTGLAELVAQRELLALDSEHHGSPSGRLGTHADALASAGFGEVGTLWQFGEDKVLCAVRAG